MHRARSYLTIINQGQIDLRLHPHACVQDSNYVHVKVVGRLVGTSPSPYLESPGFHATLDKQYLRTRTQMGWICKVSPSQHRETCVLRTDCWDMQLHAGCHEQFSVELVIQQVCD